MSKQIVVNVGERFGRLVVAGESDRRKQPCGDSKRIMKCICDCGNSELYYLSNLKKGNTKSCGCIRKEEMRKKQTTHGMVGTRFYRIWTLLISRCRNKNVIAFKNYGGRGIKCEWKSFENFKKDMYGSYQLHIEEFNIKNTTIDRIDNNGNYSKENCRWATRKEQANNTSKNVLYEFNEEKLNAEEWAKKIGLNPNTFRSRLYGSKWSIKKALTTPKMKNQFG